jgi:hypothetical protein
VGSFRFTASWKVSTWWCVAESDIRLGAHCLVDSNDRFVKLRAPRIGGGKERKAQNNGGENEPVERKDTEAEPYRGEKPR